jgi:hypothetical protein
LLAADPTRVLDKVPVMLLAIRAAAGREPG